MSARIHVINLTPGSPYIEWCDQCLRSHAHVNIYVVSERGVTRLGVWREGHAADEEIR